MALDLSSLETGTLSYWWQRGDAVAETIETGAIEDPAGLGFVLEAARPNGVQPGPELRVAAGRVHHETRLEGSGPLGVSKPDPGHPGAARPSVGFGHETLDRRAVEDEAVAARAHAKYIERIDGDPHAVVGLSIPLLRTLVRELGYSWHDLWNR